MMLDLPVTTPKKPFGALSKRPRSYIVALELQELLVKDCRNPDTKPAIRAVCARTWEILEERKRVLRMKPMPKSVDVEKIKAERRLAKSRTHAEATGSEPDPEKESLST